MIGWRMGLTGDQEWKQQPVAAHSKKTKKNSKGMVSHNMKQKFYRITAI